MEFTPPRITGYIFTHYKIIDMKKTVLLLALSVLLIEANAQKKPAIHRPAKARSHKLPEAPPPPPPPVLATPPDAPMVEAVPAPPPPPPPPIVRKTRFKAPKPVKPPKPVKEI